MANKSMEGQKAPDFRAKDQDGKTWSLGDFRGKDLVLYFYPKDDTPGCTKQACGFRDSIHHFTKTGAAVVGVSPDTVESHKRFAEKHGLVFTLLADPDHKIAEAYDVWQEKNMYGKRFFGVTRSTFVIDPDGVIRKVYGRVRVEGHPEELLEVLDSAP